MCTPSFRQYTVLQSQHTHHGIVEPSTFASIINQSINLIPCILIPKHVRHTLSCLLSSKSCVNIKCKISYHINNKVTLLKHVTDNFQPRNRPSGVSCRVEEECEGAPDLIFSVNRVWLFNVPLSTHRVAWEIYMLNNGRGYYVRKPTWLVLLNNEMNIPVKSLI